MNRRFFGILIASAVLIFLVSCKTSPKENPNFLGDFDPINIGKVTAGIVKRTNSEIKPTDFSFAFAPRSNIVYFQHKYMLDNIEIFLTQENREVLIEAIQKYLDAYNEKKLEANNANKKAFFGKTNVFMTWGLFAGAAHEAKPTLRAEYQLLSNNRPYFILASATVKALKDDANSPALRIALSPAHCEDFIALLKQENLAKIVEEMQKDFERFEPAGNSENETSENSGVNYEGF